MRVDIFPGSLRFVIVGDGRIAWAGDTSTTFAEGGISDRQLIGSCGKPSWSPKTGLIEDILWTSLRSI